MTKRILPFILVTSCVPTTFCPSTGNDTTVCVGAAFAAAKQDIRARQRRRARFD
jgi:hypothetical protein